MTTQAQQRTAIGEALAVGCFARGVTAIAATTMTLEAAFRKAWRDWEGRGDYRFVRASFERNDIKPILFDSERRRGPCIAAWSTSERGWLQPYLIVDWEMREVIEHLEETGETEWGFWMTLVDAFLEYFQEGELRGAESG